MCYSDQRDRCSSPAPCGERFCLPPVRTENSVTYQVLLCSNSHDDKPLLNMYSIPGTRVGTLDKVNTIIPPSHRQDTEM